MITSIVELNTSSQIYKVLQRLDEYDIKFAEQARVNGELQRKNEGLQRTNENLQKTIAGLATNVARVSYTSSFMTPA
jgi:hypothetical protein